MNPFFDGKLTNLGYISIFASTSIWWMKIRPKNGHFDRFLSQLMINIDIKVY